MKVIKRSQVTEVVTERIVFHELDLNGVKYERIKSFKVRIPFMDCRFSSAEPVIKWNVYADTNVIQKLSNKEVQALKLNELFEVIDQNEKNGNA